MCGMDEGQPGFQLESRVLRGSKRRLQGKTLQITFESKGVFPPQLSCTFIVAVGHTSCVSHGGRFRFRCLGI